MCVCLHACVCTPANATIPMSTYNKRTHPQLVPPPYSRTLHPQDSTLKEPLQVELLLLLLPPSFAWVNNSSSRPRFNRVFSLLRMDRLDKCCISQAQTQAQAHTHTYIHTPKIFQMYVELDTYAHTHTHTYIHVHAYRHTHVRTHTITHTHFLTYTYIQANKHTHTHTHTRGCVSVTKAHCHCNV